MLREPSSIESSSFTVNDHALPPDSPVNSRSSLVSRVRHRLFPPTPPADVPGPTASNLPAVHKRKAGFQASISEMLLVSRLKARNKHDSVVSDVGILERATQVIFVTCKNWFASPQGRVNQHKTRL